MLTKIKVFAYIQWKFTKTSPFFQTEGGGGRPARRSWIRLWSFLKVGPTETTAENPQTSQRQIVAIKKMHAQTNILN